MFRSWTITRRLIASFIAVTAIFLVVAGTRTGDANRISRQAAAQRDLRAAQADAADRAERLLWEMDRNVTQVLLSPDAAAAGQLAAATREGEAALAEQLAIVAGAGAAHADLVEAFEDVHHELADVWEQVAVLVAGGQAAEAVGLHRADSEALTLEAMGLTAQMVQATDELIAADEVRAEAASTRSRIITLALAAVVAVLVGAFGWFVARSVSRPVSRSASAVTGSSDELAALSTQLGAAAEETAAQANVVAAAGEQVSHNVSTVATAVEEMNASVREIASNAGQASEVATAAVAEAEATNATVAKLGESSAEISQVLEVITSIAEQTNLLALNATIEAARAGEAGKGFAVVANEVKELAKETSKATEEIGARISAIQADTDGAVDAIGRIREVIAEVATLQTTIAGAVEEQTATTSEIARNVNEAARGSADIAENITSVASAAQQTSAGAQSTREAAAQLAQVADQLQALVGHGDDDRGQTPTTAGGRVPAPVPA